MKEISYKSSRGIIVICLILLFYLISSFSPVCAQENYPPVANLNLDTSRHENPEAVEVLQPAYFDGSSSYDPDGSNITFTWDFGDGNVDTGIKTAHTYKKVGFYKVSLTVYDGNINSTSTINIIVISSKPHPPVAEGGLSQEVNASDIVTLDGSASYDPDGDPLTYIWDFGDGSEEGYGAITTHLFDKEGIYRVTLTVKDYVHTSNDTVIIKVGEGPVINPGEPSEDDGGDDDSELFLWLTIGIIIVILVLFILGWIYSRNKSRSAVSESVSEPKRSAPSSIQSEIDELLSKPPPSRAGSREAPASARRVASTPPPTRGRPRGAAPAARAGGPAARRGASAPIGRGPPPRGAPDKSKGRVARTIDVDAYRKRLATLEKSEEKKREKLLKKQLEDETKKMEKEMEKDLKDLGLEF